MTAKRFTIPKGYRVIKDNVTDECATFYDNDDGETFLKWLNELHEENQLLKQRLAEQNDVEWLRNNTVWQVMPSSHRTYTSTIYHRRNDE